MLQIKPKLIKVKLGCVEVAVEVVTISQKNLRHNLFDILSHPNLIIPLLQATIHVIQSLMCAINETRLETFQMSQGFNYFF